MKRTILGLIIMAGLLFAAELASAQATTVTTGKFISGSKNMMELGYTHGRRMGEGDGTLWEVTWAEPRAVEQVMIWIDETSNWVGTTDSTAIFVEYLVLPPYLPDGTDLEDAWRDNLEGNFGTAILGPGGFRAWVSTTAGTGLAFDTGTVTGYANIEAYTSGNTYATVIFTPTDPIVPTTAATSGGRDEYARAIGWCWGVRVVLQRDAEGAGEWAGSGWVVFADEKGLW